MGRKINCVQDSCKRILSSSLFLVDDGWRLEVGILLTSSFNLKLNHRETSGTSATEHFIYIYIAVGIYLVCNEMVYFVFPLCG